MKNYGVLPIDLVGALALTVLGGLLEYTRTQERPHLRWRKVRIFAIAVLAFGDGEEDEMVVDVLGLRSLVGGARRKQQDSM